ncbi:hypothetical protein PGTUg99_037021 [Puccinia graminis f. sp. tritici]|uniref:Uncharacterized protein n=1 Tax=Puccinia graminis f. sp. tritici TaxID=56615 RepID=A0A5B0SMM1_PUCGR|nr:hypothetical protein PGTUg99_037021 [Puccinia graminis f. sp. tritici]
MWGIAFDFRRNQSAIPPRTRQLLMGLLAEVGVGLEVDVVLEVGSSYLKLSFFGAGINVDCDAGLFQAKKNANTAFSKAPHPLALPPPLVKRGVIDAVGPSCSHWLRRRALEIEAPAEIIKHPAQVKSAVSATQELTKGTEPLSNELRENVNGQLGLDSLAHQESKPPPAALDPLSQPSGTTSISESGHGTTPITEPRTSDSQEVDLKKGEGVGSETHGNEQNGVLSSSQDHEIIPGGSNLHSATEPHTEGIESSANPHGSNDEIKAAENLDVVPQGHQHEEIAENHQDHAHEPNGGGVKVSLKRLLS